MSSQHDPIYVAARRVLLDALFALRAHESSIVVVGAQAICLRTGDANLAIAAYTTDADLAIDSRSLGTDPTLEDAMRLAGFAPQTGDRRQPGAWSTTVMIDQVAVEIPVDLMVPSGLAPAGGTRSARLHGHDRMAARLAPGLEAALVDRSPIDIRSLDPAGDRQIRAQVAGPAALIVAKVFKINDRLAQGPDRVEAKDAADTYRLMQTTPAEDFNAAVATLLADEVSREVTTKALELLRTLFANRESVGVALAVDSLRTAVPAERIAAVCGAFLDAIDALT